MKAIINPILPGFNPDPSILRVGDDYYIATSTFQWFPGVQIHHSRDLIHWKLLTRPLRRRSQLDMIGNPDSGGVWAPCLSYHEGSFYLIYTDVKFHRGAFKDTHNYLVTANDICGDWSDPVYLNSSGFDPSLFHDGDRKWLVNMQWGHDRTKNQFTGIVLQEYSAKEKRLVGPITNIFKGTDIKYTEGPHLYKRGDYYYLMTAEGGTWISHAVTMARSKSLLGPYEVDPQNPVLTSYYDCTLPLQRAGHASIVETQNGEWYMVHLCGRPIPSRGLSVMGRESAIQKVEWTQDGWLRLADGGQRPSLKVPAPKLPEHPFEPEPPREDFDSDTLNIHFQFLRLDPGEEFISLKKRKGFLRLHGAESLSSLHRQTLVARRQQAYCYTASTCVEFEPVNFQQMAGLICYYDTRNYYYLHVTFDEERGKVLRIMQSVGGENTYPFEEMPLVAQKTPCFLRAQVVYDKLYFSYSTDAITWTRLGTALDAATLSDEFDIGGAGAHFTGAFVGLACQDISGQRLHADFDWFEYQEDTR